MPLEQTDVIQASFAKVAPIAPAARPARQVERADG
jgi:hypothetical protein